MKKNLLILGLGLVCLAACAPRGLHHSSSNEEDAPSESSSSDSSLEVVNPDDPSSSSSSLSSAGVSSSSSSSGSSSSLDELEPQEVLKYGFRDLNNSQYADSLPTTGQYSILVLPIEFTDYKFSESELADFDWTLNAEEGTAYWESLSSYYYKSSYGQLDLSFVVADVYESGYTARGAYNQFGASGRDNGITLINAAFNEYSSAHDVQQFDTDDNGWIDGVIAVYSCPDYYSGNLSYDQTSFYWAYTYWAQNEPNINSPTVNLYFWLSIDFIYEGGDGDAHTLIHEFGHMLGLDDLYSDSSYGTAYAGGLDMMDLNILDHGAYAKILLGWLKPYVVTEEATIEITPSTTTPSAIIVPSSSWNGNAFNEYLVIELYSPIGLNEHDSLNSYSDRPRGYSKPGVKISHIDARAMEVSYNQWGQLEDSVYYYGDNLDGADDYTYYSVGATNCQKDYYPASTRYNFNTLIDASSPSGTPFTYGTYADNSTLFQAGDSFDIQTYRSYFANRGKFNNGDEFPFSIDIVSVDSESAIIDIHEA